MRIKYTCKHCGGTNVTMDCVARWNVDAQKWEMSAELDNTDCDDCGGETTLVEVPA